LAWINFAKRCKLNNASTLALERDGREAAYVELSVGWFEAANGWRAPYEQGAHMTPQAPLVLDPLTYIEQVEKLKTKPAFVVPTDFFVANQHELKDLPELEPQSGALDVACRAMTQTQKFIQDIHSLAFYYDAELREEIERFFGTHSADKLLDRRESGIALIRESLDAHVDKGRLSHAMNRIAEVVKKLDGRSGTVVIDLRTFLTEVLGKEGQDDATLRSSWLQLQAELARINSLRPALDEIARVSALIETGGAKKWAVRVRTRPAEGDNDPVVPSAWREAWNWRRLLAVVLCTCVCRYETRGDLEHRLSLQCHLPPLPSRGRTRSPRERPLVRHLSLDEPNPYRRYWCLINRPESLRSQP
jgi:hypothetical protein